MTKVLVKDPQIITTTLPNGFRVIYEKSFEKRPVSSINVFCDLGSIYEKPGYNGISHFIEHMWFNLSEAGDGRFL
jgi:predicted Zn-dependent peptidase